jgi:hypothetical protein
MSAYHLFELYCCSQMFLVRSIFHEETLTIHQFDITVRATHLHVIRLEVAISNE